MLNLVFLCGGSGSGKSSLEKSLLALETSSFSRVISSTSRPQRKGETQGVDYRFLEAGEFEKMLDEGLFLQKTFFGGHHYGTLFSDYSSEKPITLFTALPSSIIDVCRELEKASIPFASKTILFDISRRRLEENMLSRGDSPLSIQKRLAHDRINEDFMRLGLMADFVVRDEDLTPCLTKRISGWLHSGLKKNGHV